MYAQETTVITVGCSITVTSCPGITYCDYFLTGLVKARHAIATHYSTSVAPLTEDVRT